MGCSIAIAQLLSRLNSMDICYLDWLALLAILGEERAKNTHPETILLLAPTDSPKASFGAPLSADGQ
jgi:hypothetical protein